MKERDRDFLLREMEKFGEGLRALAKAMDERQKLIERLMVERFGPSVLFKLALSQPLADHRPCFR